VKSSIGNSFDTIVPPQHRDAHRRGLQRFVATGEGRVLNTRIEITALHRDGHEFPVELAVWAVRSGESWTFHAFVHDVTERKRAEETLRQLNRALEEERNAVRDFNRCWSQVRDRTQDLRRANLELRERNRQLLDARAQAATDSLTSLPNHRSFHERIRAAVSAAETSGASVSAIMLDIDRFKTVNDKLGHLAGDEILRACGEILAGAAGAENVYRYGGDEFALILDKTDIEHATAVAEELRTAIESRSPDLRGITISLGVAEFPHISQSAEELIYRADAAMYTAKSAGKNRACRWDRIADVADVADAAPTRRAATVK
jgi:diguanylate cyclase (GGDEF)-like protein